MVKSFKLVSFEINRQKIHVELLLLSWEHVLKLNEQVFTRSLFFTSIEIRFFLYSLLVDSLNGCMIEQQRPLLVKFADDDKRRRQLMARYLPQTDPNLSTTFPNTLRDPSDVLTAQMAQLNLLANTNPLPGFNSTTNPIDNQQQQGQDMNLLMNTLLMMPFWSNMCASTMSMPLVYPSTNISTTNKTVDPLAETMATTAGASAERGKTIDSISFFDFYLDPIHH